MAKRIIRTGTTADPTGDSLKNAFVKVNDNFTELYNALGLDADTLNIGAFEFAGSVMTTTDSSAIVIDQAVTITSNLSVGGDILPQTALGGDLGSSTLPWRSLYVSNNTIYIGGTAVGLDANGNLTTGGTVVGSTPAWANITGKPTFATVATTGVYADLTGKPTIPTLVSQLANDSGFLTSGGNISNIQSESDVSIQVNLTDSTTRIWRFGEDGDLTLPSTSGFIDRLYTDNGGSRTKLEKKIESSPTAGTIAKLELDLDNGHIRLAIGNYTGGNDQWIDTSTWAFRGDTGSLTLPPAGKIINNNKEWIFGTNGKLTFPNGSTIGDGDAVFGVPITTTRGTIFLGNQAECLGGENHFHIMKAGQQEIDLFLGDDNNYVKLPSTGGVEISSSEIGAQYYWQFGTDGALTLPGDIKSNGNINIDINLSDSTLRRWQFGEDGSLTLPSVGKINNGAYDWTFGSTGNTTFPTGLTLAAARGPNTVNFTSGIDKEFQIETQTNTTGRLWQFGTDGALTLPGDIKSNGNINIEINLSDSTKRIWQFGEDGLLTFPDGTSQSTAGGAGGGSTLVNGAYTVSLGSTGTLTVPANGVITAPINQEFQLQAKAADSVLRNEINLDPNNGTYMSVWSEEFNASFSTGAGSWATASWNNEGGFGAARFTGAEDLQDFWTIGPGSFVESVEVSINGGARGRAGYEGTNGGGSGVYISVDQVPPGGQGTTVPITSLVFYFRTKNRIDIDYLNGQLLLNTQSMNINLETNSYINLKSTRENPVRIITNNNTHMWEFDSTGSLTLPREGKIYGIGQGAASDRYGYISWDGNSSGDGSGYNTMRLVPDQQGLEDSGQYIILDPTSPGHIHIRAGGTQDNSGADLYLGGENSHIKIGAGANPPVTVMADDNSWIFGTDGAITTSDAFTIKTPNGVPSSVSNWVGGGGWNSPPYTNLATTGGTGTGLTVNVSTAAGGYININAITINTAGTGYTNGDVITINNENNIPGTFTIGVAGTNSWAFGTSGDLTIPGDIKGTANTSIIVDNVVLFANVTVEQAQPYGPSGSRVFISESAYPTLGSLVQVGDTVTIGWGSPITVTITNITGGGFWELRFNQIITAELILNPGTITITSAQVNTWTFDNDGGLTFPDGTVQTTAWTGTFSTLSVTGAVTAERFNTDQITVVGNRISTTVTNANLELECNGTGGVVINAVADATTASTVKSVGYLGLPQSATATSGTLAIGDAGKHIYVTTAGQTIAIPDNSSVAYPIGTTLTFIAGPSATTVLIVISQDTLRLAGSSSTGTRTLAANGMATAVKVASTLWYINGIGLT